MSATLLKQFHAILWNVGTDHYQRGEFGECLGWFKRSLSTLSHSDVINRTKCIRVISRCHIQLEESKAAEESINEAIQIDPNNCRKFLRIVACDIYLLIIGNHFVLFKIFLQKRDAQGASLELIRMCECHDFSPDLLEVCALEALESKQYNITSDALEK